MRWVNDNGEEKGKRGRGKGGREEKNVTEKEREDRGNIRKTEKTKYSVEMPLHLQSCSFGISPYWHWRE